MRLVTDRAFGFIKDDGGEDEYFMHRSSCLPQSLFDDLVTAANNGQPPLLCYQVGSSPKGPRAYDVRLATEEEEERHEEQAGNR